jgi:hypothetical protein
VGARRRQVRTIRQAWFHAWRQGIFFSASAKIFGEGPGRAVKRGLGGAESLRDNRTT